MMKERKYVASIDIGIARALGGMGQIDQALEILATVEKEYGDIPKTCLDAAQTRLWMLWGLAEWEKASQAAEHIQIAYKSERAICASAALCIGWTLISAGKSKEAIKAFERVEKNYSDQRAQCAAAAANIGHVHRHDRQWGNALFSYSRVFIDYQDQPAHCAGAALGIADCFRDQGQHDEALTAYRRVERDYSEQHGASASAAFWRCTLEARKEAKARVSAAGDIRQAARERGVMVANARSFLRKKLAEKAALVKIKRDWKVYRLARFFSADLDEKGFDAELEYEKPLHRNDAAYAVGLALEILGDRRGASKWYGKSLRLTKANEWPATDARRRLMYLTRTW